MLSYKFRITSVTKNRAFMLAVYVMSALALLALSTLISSGVITTLDDPLGSISIGAFASLLGSALISGFAVSKISGEPKQSLTAHLIGSGILFAFGVIFGGGVGGFMNSICYLGLSAVGAFLGRRRGKKHRRVK